MAVLVTGSRGQLGTDVLKALERAGESSVAVTRADADLADPEAVRALVHRHAPTAVVNCAAFHDVGGCELDPDLAYAINATAVEALASACRDVDAALMTVSTDYVFDGARPGGYTERDAPNPLNVYGASKLEGEERARAGHRKVFVVRTQSLYGTTPPSGKGRNFVELVLELAREREELKVDQFRMAPTSTATLAANMIDLLGTEHYGLYHMSCQGETTWHAFARSIVDLAELDVRVVPVSNDFYPTPFVRPEATYLLNDALQDIELDRMPAWEDALVSYLTAREGAPVTGIAT